MQEGHILYEGGNNSNQHKKDDSIMGSMVA